MERTCIWSVNPRICSRCRWKSARPMRKRATRPSQKKQSSTRRARSLGRCVTKRHRNHGRHTVSMIWNGARNSCTWGMYSCMRWAKTRWWTRAPRSVGVYVSGRSRSHSAQMSQKHSASGRWKLKKAEMMFIDWQYPTCLLCAAYDSSTRRSTASASGASSFSLPSANDRVMSFSICRAINSVSDRLPGAVRSADMAASPIPVSATDSWSSW
mmetsp:Transcript_6577/g.18590  ORF Transcript_6577/g.18590 Transcript_6577/m.18590 type:complete len:212 (+) Transcript_6577:836-1471(+)